MVNSWLIDVHGQLSTVIVSNDYIMKTQNGHTPEFTQCTSVGYVFPGQRKFVIFDRGSHHTGECPGQPQIVFECFLAMQQLGTLVDCVPSMAA